MLPKGDKIWKLLRVNELNDISKFPHYIKGKRKHLEGIKLVHKITLLKAGRRMETTKSA